MEGTRSGSRFPTVQSDTEMLIILALVSLVWLSIVCVVLAICRMAAHDDGSLPQSPRRPSTCGTVRSRILTSPQSDQLATYR